MATSSLGRFVISAAEARTRLKSTSLSKSQRELAVHQLEDDELVAWIDVPWSVAKGGRAVKRAARKGTRTQDALDVAAIVFEHPFEHDEFLSLRYATFALGLAPRNASVLVFLGEVHVRDVCLVPEMLAIFGGGLRVDRLAVFDGGDSHADIAKHLHAPLVVSGVSGGSAVLAAGCTTRIAKYARYIGKLPRGAAKAYDTAGEMLPWLGERLEEAGLDEDDADAWEIFETLNDEGLLADFPVPKLPAARTGSAAKKPAPAKKPAAAKKPAPKKAAPKRSAGETIEPKAPTGKKAVAKKALAKKSTRTR